MLINILRKSLPIVPQGAPFRPMSTLSRPFTRTFSSTNPLASNKIVRQTKRLPIVVADDVLVPYCGATLEVTNEKYVRLFEQMARKKFENSFDYINLSETNLPNEGEMNTTINPSNGGTVAMMLSHRKTREGCEIVTRGVEYIEFENHLMRDDNDVLFYDTLLMAGAHREPQKLENTQVTEQLYLFIKRRLGEEKYNELSESGVIPKDGKYLFFWLLANLPRKVLPLHEVKALLGYTRKHLGALRLLRRLAEIDDQVVIPPNSQSFEHSSKRNSLYNWIISQRRKYTQGTLSPSRIERLNSIDFPWLAEPGPLKPSAHDAPTKGSEDLFNLHYVKLVAYKQTHGHFDVPRLSKEEEGLVSVIKI
ncbi:hypothetical protein PROFUN_12543 [Planoprotostelium fungivorum]|uniref:Helicase-associated domain-containing protein n=1 Tax=Planoprotostelium fungivorum TaxID=1890364 RepID=A0A2P6N768_9EUKA|nr:hypothetical protein PROFUN_12543 [Planoprotostelium fungivorum]